MHLIQELDSSALRCRSNFQEALDVYTPSRDQPSKPPPRFKLLPDYCPKVCLKPVVFIPALIYTN